MHLVCHCFKWLVFNGFVLLLMVEIKKARHDVSLRCEFLTRCVMLVEGVWNLEFRIWNLEFGIWNLLGLGVCDLGGLVIVRFFV